MDELQKENGKYDYVCCTVAPFNIPSLKDKFSRDGDCCTEGEIWW